MPNDTCLNARIKKLNDKLFSAKIHSKQLSETFFLVNSFSRMYQGGIKIARNRSINRNDVFKTVFCCSNKALKDAQVFWRSTEEFLICHIHRTRKP